MSGFAKWLVGIVLLCAAAGPAAAQQGWAPYTDPRSGAKIMVPADLIDQRQETATGTTFTGPGIRIEVSSRPVPGVRTSADLRRFIAAAPGYDRVTYRAGGTGWLVVSGYRGENIFYEKFFVRPGSVRGFSIQYPTAERAIYDPLVEYIEDTYRPGG